MSTAPGHGSLVAAGDHCLSPARAVDRPTGAARYGRMFPGLDPLGAEPGVLRRAGGDGGICDAPRSSTGWHRATTPPRPPGGRSSAS